MRMPRSVNPGEFGRKGKKENFSQREKSPLKRLAGTPPVVCALACRLVLFASGRVSALRTDSRPDRSLPASPCRPYFLPFVGHILSPFTRHAWPQLHRSPLLHPSCVSEELLGTGGEYLVELRSGGGAGGRLRGCGLERQRRPGACWRLQLSEALLAHSLALPRPALAWLLAPPRLIHSIPLLFQPPPRLFYFTRTLHFSTSLVFN